MTTNTGHGHVRPRPDGIKARCGGPAICSECAREKAQLGVRPGPTAIDVYERALQCIAAGEGDPQRVARLALAVVKHG